MENQLTILAESLDQKIQVLQEIQKYNERQEQVFTDSTVSMDAFDEAVEEKGKLIERLTLLDSGFETMYKKLGEQLKGNREKYADQIRMLQAKITTVTEMSVTIQAQEKRNKQLVEQFFARERAGLQQSRKTSKAAYDYYRKMSSVSTEQPQFYDSKK